MKNLIWIWNKIAKYYKGRDQKGDFALPPLIDNTSECNRCFSKNLCATNAIAFDELIKVNSIWD